MGSRGPIAGDPEKLAGHGRGVAATELRPADAAVRPRRLLGARHYSRATRRWWAAWATSLQASQIDDVAWLGLERLAPRVEAFFASTDALERVRLLRVVRQTESAYGCTIADRARLRWRIAAPAEAASPANGLSGHEPTRRGSRSKADPRLRLVGD